MERSGKQPSVASILDANDNFLAAAAYSSTMSSAASASLSNPLPTGRIPPKRGKENAKRVKEGARVPYALAFLNSLRREKGQYPPFRYYGMDLVDSVRTAYPFVYRINDGVSNNTVLQQVCEERGWAEFKMSTSSSQRDREVHDEVGWNIWWSYNFYQSSPHRSLRVWQYTNHNPRPFLFCNKSALMNLLKKMVSEYGETFDFAPKGFSMPEDYVRFLTEHSRRKHVNCSDFRNVILVPTGDISSLSRPGTSTAKKLTSWKTVKAPIWISKPVGKSQGKGIYLTTDVNIIANENRSVIQEYISRPHLIGGYKWDLRIYVCVASTDPLVIYLYREGLCRFATEKYDLGNLAANFSHLTNASLNKLGPDYPTEKEIVGAGCKWSLKQLRKHFKDSGVYDWYLWQRIMSMVVLTVVGEALRSGYCYPAHRNCFDFFGFDILVDETLRPWLLEVNYSPGLGYDCDVDDIVKKPMLHELFDLLRFPSSDDEPVPLKKIVPDTAVRASDQSKLALSIDKFIQLQQPPTVEKTPKPFDYSCKARLKEASSIYSQDLVAELIEKYSKDPNFKLTRGMKAILKKKKAEDRARRMKNAQSMKVKPVPENGAAGLCPSDIDSTLDENGNEVGAGAAAAMGGEDEPPSPNRISADGEAGNFAEPEVPPSRARRPSSAAKSVDPKNEDCFLCLKKQDWVNPPKKQGSWVLVYPCKCFPYKSPYRSSVSDLRGIIKLMENYLQIAQFVFGTYPTATDDFLKAKMKALCRWDIDLWTPPEQIDPRQQSEDIDEEEGEDATDYE